MAQNFSKMTKDELSSLIGSAGQLREMTSSELKQLQRVATEAGVLGAVAADKIAMQLNAKAYEEILTSKDYTAEEKAEAMGYLKEYNAEIIKSRAKVVDGKYHFDYLSKGEMDLLMESGALSFNDIKLAQNYKVGQEKDRDFSKEITPITQEVATTVAAPIPAAVASEVAQIVPTPVSQLPADLQKSYDFWNKFNEKAEQTGVKYKIDNMEDKHLLVEAKKGDQTIFKGIDRGSKGFDIIKRDKSAEPYEMFDALVKKVKAGNPKTVIRIKDNVTDAVLRNKILIACAKNKMTPAGNLPEGFDFAQLQKMVVGLNTTEEINALARSLYAPEEFSFGQENTDTEKAQVIEKTSKAQEEKKESVTNGVVASINSENEDISKPSDTREVEEKKKNPVVGGVAIVPTSGGNQGGKISPTSDNDNKGATTTILYKQAVRPWWKKVRDAVIIGGLGLLTWIGLKNNKEIKDAKQDTIESVNRMAAENCEAYTKLVDENAALRKDNSTLQQAVDDCGKTKVTNKTSRKAVKKTPAKAAPVAVLGEPTYVQGPTIHIAGKVIQDADVHVPGKTIVDPAPVAPAVKKTQVEVPAAAKTPEVKKPRRSINFNPQHGLDNDLNNHVVPTNTGATASTAAPAGEKMETVNLLSQADKDAIAKGKTISFAQALKDNYNR